MKVELNNQQIEEILNKTLYPMLITSKKTRTVVYANPYAQKQYETNLETLIGMEIDRLYTRETQREEILASINENGLIENLEMEYKTLKGNTFFGLLSLDSIIYNDEDCFLGVVTDITKQKKQQHELEKMHQELNKYKDILELKIEEEIDKRKEQEEILIQQSKLASMGEMIDAIAHQWMQPLTIMSMQVDMLKYDDRFDKEALSEFEDKFRIQKKHMISTLSEFRDFLRPNKETNFFKIEKAINTTLTLVHDDISKYSIQIEKDFQDDFEIEAVENEFIHVLLNIINNAKDIFKHQKYKEDKTIKISTKKDADSHLIIIDDNAGGIPEDIIENIFEVNFTTKKASGGTGIGLYMSKQIVEKHNGSIKATNIENGARFIIKL